MVKVANALLIGVTLAATFFVFSNREGLLEIDGRGSQLYQDEASMIPGAEAVRPLAANQSLRVNEILAELKYPSPSHATLSQLAPSPDAVFFTGILQNPRNNPRASEVAYVKKGKIILTRTDYYDADTGAHYARSWERFRDGKLVRKIDERFDAEGRLTERSCRLFGANGELINTRVLP